MTGLYYDNSSRLYTRDSLIQVMLAFIICFLLVVVAVGILWIALVLYRKRFVLRDKLQKADAIVVLAGTRGNMRFLQGKISTAVRLYQERWAPIIICTGKFSVKVSETPTLIPVEALQEAAVVGRIEASIRKKSVFRKHESDFVWSH